MQLSDLSKDVQRLLMRHWNEDEINSRLSDPEYFFDQLVIPRMEFLRRQGEYAPTIRIQRTPQGELRIVLLP